MSDLVDRYIAMRERLQELANEHAALQYNTDLARSRYEIPEEDLVDIGYTERQIEKLFDHHRKESKARQLGIGSELCGLIMERFGNGEGKLRGQGRIASCTPDVKLEPIIPRKGDDDYDAIMNSVGIPAELARTGVVAIHYKNMGDHLTALAAEGKNPPGRLLKRAVPQVEYRSTKRKT